MYLTWGGGGDDDGDRNTADNENDVTGRAMSTLLWSRTVRVRAAWAVSPTGQSVIHDHDDNGDGDDFLGNNGRLKMFLQMGEAKKRGGDGTTTQTSQV